MKTIVSLALTALLFANSNLASNSKTDDCNGCEYDLIDEDKESSQGQYDIFTLKCKTSSNKHKYEVWRQKESGKWWPSGSSKKYDTKCDMVKYMCDCEK